jgi:outer membrane protein
MRKINLFALLFSLMLSNTMFAQLEKGSFLMGGTNWVNPELSSFFGSSQRQLLGFNVDLTSETNANQFSLSPDFGYFVTKSIVVGGQIGVLRAKFGDESATLFSIAPKVRFYFNPNSAKMNVYAHLRPSLLSVASDGDNESALGVALGAGLSTFLSPDVVLNSELSFADSDLDVEDNNLINLNIGLQAYLNPSGRQAAKSAVSGFRAGTWMLGGSTADLTLGLYDGSFSSLSIRSQIGYFVIPKLVVGLGVGLDRTSLESPLGKIRSSTFSVGPQLRYYFNSSKRVVWFGEADYAYNRVGSRIGDEDYGFNFSSFGVKAGLNLFISKNIAFEWSTGPRFTRGSGDSEVKGTSWNTQVGFNYFLGTDGGE